MAKFGDARDNGMAFRSTMPARTRDGASYPGGKHMRKALHRLHLRRDGEQSGNPADHGLNAKGAVGVTVPGSMTR